MLINYNLLVLVLLTVNSIQCFKFRAKIKDTISKAKELYKKKFLKDKTWHFLGYDKTEYPGTDKGMLKINVGKWNEYYACLKKQENSLENHGSIIPEAIVAYEGQLIT